MMTWLPGFSGSPEARPPSGGGQATIIRTEAGMGLINRTALAPNKLDELHIQIAPTASALGTRESGGTERPQRCPLPSSFH